MRRRWYVVLVGLLFTVAITIVMGQIVPSHHELTANVLLLPPKSDTTQAPQGENPYLSLGGLDTMSSIVGRAVTGTDVEDALAATGATADYTVEPDQTVPGPVLLVTVDDPDRQVAEKTMEAVLQTIPVSLRALQNMVSTPADSFITSTVIKQDRTGTIVRKSQYRAFVAGAGAGLLLTVLAAVLVDLLMLRRRPAGGGDVPTVAPPAVADAAPAVASAAPAAAAVAAPAAEPRLGGAEPRHPRVGPFADPASRAALGIPPEQAAPALSPGQAAVAAQAAALAAQAEVGVPLGASVANGHAKGANGVNGGATAPGAHHDGWEPPRWTARLIEPAIAPDAGSPSAPGRPGADQAHADAAGEAAKGVQPIPRLSSAASSVAYRQLASKDGPGGADAGDSGGADSAAAGTAGTPGAAGNEPAQGTGTEPPSGTDSSGGPPTGSFERLVTGKVKGPVAGKTTGKDGRGGTDPRAAAHRLT